jgi:hypothetical protein
MRVFISWSGERSKAIGAIFYEWLQTVIQSIDPWMSEHNVEKGTNWGHSLSRELEEDILGLICLTPENLTAPWLMFEAGALSKSGPRSRVWTLLYELQNSDVKGPLAQFQHTRIEKEDIRQLLHDMNTASGSPLIKESVLDVSFERGWPDLERRLAGIPAAPAGGQAPGRSTEDMVREMLELVREQSKLMRRLPTVSSGSSLNLGLLNPGLGAPQGAVGAAALGGYVMPGYLGIPANLQALQKPIIDEALKQVHASANIGDAAEVSMLGKGIVNGKTDTLIWIKFDLTGISVAFDLGDSRVRIVNKNPPEAGPTA